MSPLAKVFVVVNLILSVAFFGSSATLFATRKNWREEALRYQKEAEKSLKDLEDKYHSQGSRLQQKAESYAKLMADYNSLSAEKNKVQTSLVDATSQLDKAGVRIDTEVKEKTQLTSTLQDLQGKQADLTRLLETARKESEDAKGQKEQAVNEMTRFRVDLDKVNQELSKHLIELAEVNSKAETMQIMIAAATKSGCPHLSFNGIPPPIDAVVQAVKTEDKLVVLSVGRDQKVQEGFEFTVYRGDRFVGKVKVIKVYEDLAGARVLYTNDNEAIQVGDKAATQL